MQKNPTCTPGRDHLVNELRLGKYHGPNTSLDHGKGVGCVFLTVCIDEISVDNAKQVHLIPGVVPVDMTPRPCACAHGHKKSPPAYRNHELTCPSSGALSELKHLSLHNDRRLNPQE